MRYILSQTFKAVSKSIFKNQSSLKNNLKDLFYSINLSNKYDIKYGKIDLSNVSFIESKSKERGNLIYMDKSKISEGYNVEKNEFFDKIISENLKSIQSYLGKNFITEQALFFRNYKISENLKTHDIYSNIWHQDSHDGFKLLKIFVLLGDVTQKDGPFIFLDRNSTKKHFSKLRERWSFENLKNLKKFDEEILFTGKKGDYVIINTANCMHRASIPSNYRDMAQITIKPRWRK